MQKSQQRNSSSKLMFLMRHSPRVSPLFKVTLANGGSITRGELLMALALFLPGLLILLFLGVYPLVSALMLSFQKQSLFQLTSTWIGLENYLDVLTWDLFWTALKNDLVFTFGSIILQVLLGLVVALVLHQQFVGRDLFRGLSMFNYVLPVIAAALIWRFLLSDTVGVVYHTIKNLQLPIPNTWFASPKTAMPSVILVNVWKFFPFMVINFLARLQTISLDLYDAAEVDGASSWQSFYYITLPMLMPVIIIVMLLRTIWTFNNWEVIALLTHGGPVNSTITLPVLVYDTMFSQFSRGRAAAIAVLMMILLLFFMFVYLRVYDKAEEQL